MKRVRSVLFLSVCAALRPNSGRRKTSVAANTKTEAAPLLAPTTTASLDKTAVDAQRELSTPSLDAAPADVKGNRAPPTKAVAEPAPEEPSPEEPSPEEPSPEPEEADALPEAGEETDAAAAKLQARIRGRNERLNPTTPPAKTNAALVETPEADPPVERPSSAAAVEEAVPPAPARPQALAPVLEERAAPVEARQRLAPVEARRLQLEP